MSYFIIYAPALVLLVTLYAIARVARGGEQRRPEIGEEAWKTWPGEKNRTTTRKRAEK